ncbi:2OG-Fe(II) oxygenase [bacterium]|nr:2OG-Fe(II) oxygenase [bacterium]
MQSESRPPAGSLPGEWLPPSDLKLFPQSQSLELESLEVHTHSLTLLAHHVLDPRNCDLLVRAMQSSGAGCAVDVFGFSGDDARGGIRTAQTEEARGSWRATAWSPELAAQLWSLLEPAIPCERLMQDFTATDWPPHRRWRRVGLSPVLRFMRYESGGQHCCHYDQSFDYGDGRRTLLSVVFYLTEAAPGSGGRTRFVRDGQEETPLLQRNYGDWTRLTRDDEVILGVRPQLGSALIFDHRLCHDVEYYSGATPRVIVRGDVVFRSSHEVEAVGKRPCGVQ